MAWTATKVAQYNEGDKAIQHWSLTSDSATLDLITGLGNVVSVQWSPKSMTTTTTPKFYANALTTAVASAGHVSITGAVSGDDIYLTVIGN